MDYSSTSCGFRLLLFKRSCPGWRKQIYTSLFLILWAPFSTNWKLQQKSLQNACSEHLLKNIIDWYWIVDIILEWTFLGQLLISFDPRDYLTNAQMNILVIQTQHFANLSFDLRILKIPYEYYHPQSFYKYLRFSMLLVQPSKLKLS